MYKSSGIFSILGVVLVCMNVPISILYIHHLIPKVKKNSTPEKKIDCRGSITLISLAKCVLKERNTKLDTFCE